MIDFDNSVKFFNLLCCHLLLVLKSSIDLSKKFFCVLIMHVVCKITTIDQQDI